jgi:hypothetical protein
MKKVGINRYKYLRYHIENYFIRVQGLYGRVLKLINAVCDLSNDPKYCFENVILKNKKVKNADIPNFVKQLKKTLDTYISFRNEIIHHESYREEDLVLLEVLNFINRMAPKAAKKMYPPYPVVIEIFKKKIIRQKKDEFVTLNKKIEHDLIAIFDKLLHHYEKLKEV